MNEKEKEILEVFADVIPRLSETGQEKLLSYGEGMLTALTGKPGNDDNEPGAA